MVDQLPVSVPRLRLFEAYGIEIEYMIVQKDTLDVFPVSDQVLRAIAGEIQNEVEVGDLRWSNELVLHVIELKTNGPAQRLEELPERFAADARRINELLAPLGGQLMPTAMHPWMDPVRETRLWPHDSSEIYTAFDRIFGCKGHGWSNLQSVHINLPFNGDSEFGRLHAAIRLVLPLLPGLAASSPLVEGRLTGLVDNRLEYYRENCRAIPSITARVVPEPAFTEAEYEAQVLLPIATAIAPLDPEQVLEAEWVNARGAIARFSRGSIEIRVLDVQECPLADLAIVALATGLLKALVEERWCSSAEQRHWSVAALEPLFLRSLREGAQAVVEDENYRRLFGIASARALSVGQLWASVAERLNVEGLLPSAPWGEAIDVLTRSGTLGERIVRALGRELTQRRLHDVYAILCEGLPRNRLFVPESA
jgi:glutamate---cysteine ligase / carboxylate-amine ligase